MNKVLDFLKKYWFVFFVIFVICATIISGMQIYQEEILNINPDVEYEDQKTLFFAAEPIDTLNPLISQSEDVFYLSKIIYEGLFDYDDTLMATPKLVESYSVDTEKAFIKIKLKNDIKWHDGKSLTSDDVRFTVRAIKAAGSTSPYYNAVKKIIAVNIINSREISIYFHNNYDCSLDALTFPIVPSHQFSTPTKFAQVSKGFKPVGTGLYKYKAYNYLKFLKLTPNTDYDGYQSALDINVNIIPDKELASNMMEIEAVTCYVEDSITRKPKVTDKNLKMYDILSNNVDFVVFNTKKSYTKNKNFRQALAYGIDLNNILENAYMNDAVITDNLYYPNFLGIEDKQDFYGYSYQKAVNLLKNLGLEDKDEDGFLEDANKQTVTLKILVNKNNATRYAAARIIKKNLETLGFKVEMNALKKTDYHAEIRKNNFDLLLTGYSIEAGYDLRELFNGRNEWNYVNYDLFSEIRLLERLHTEEEYKEIYEKIQSMLLEELPYYALGYKKMGLIGVTRFEANELPTFNNIYKNCHTWQWSKEINFFEEKEKN